MDDQWLLGPAATGKPERCIEMIGPLFAIIGFLWGYLVARRRGGKTLDRLQYGVGFAIAFGLFGTLLGIALARFLGTA
jgi:hypothetical protein